MWQKNRRHSELQLGSMKLTYYCLVGLESSNFTSQPRRPQPSQHSSVRAYEVAPASSRQLLGLHREA